jgi:ribose 5-phosphate isomerase B
MGTDDTSASEYPRYAASVAKAVAGGEYALGVLICGTGAGMCIAANKVKGARAVVCSEPYTAKLAREHNDANILCLGARVVGSELAKMITDAWLTATFEGGRHQTRVDMITALEGL